jgi:LAS superfamily LD-carboxypeptidase LdcB
VIDGAAATLALVGQSEVHLCSVDDAGEIGVRVHMDALGPLRRLREAAAADGFDLTVHSAFRDFNRQLSIWNRKVSGALAVLDSRGAPIDIATLTPRELVYAILRWSALPGASRHHWGTDLDVFDAATTPEGYELQLVPAEVEAGGMHAPLHEWLDARIASGTALDFYRPYDADRGGVAPERWHLSYAPTAASCAQALTIDLLRGTIANADMLHKDIVLEHLDDLYARFVINVSPPPA